jgi:hypothetical protein
VRWLLLVGISLDPIAILFVCQHENIDVFVGLFVVLALWALVAYSQANDVVLWLAGCLALGLGAFVKTVPLVLLPILAPGFRAASKAGRTLGAALFLGPIVLSLSVVLALAPRAVVDNVFLYRSIRGYFGVTGLLRVAGLDGVGRAYDRVFVVVLIVSLCVIFRWAWRNGLEAHAIVLLAALLLAAVPALGPGYGPQYAYWYLPPLLASYLLLDDAWRRILLAFYAVTAATYVVEYALLRALGRFLVAFFGDSHLLQRASDRLSTPGGTTILRIPLFVAFLMLLVAGYRRLRPSHAESPAPTTA